MSTLYVLFNDLKIQMSSRVNPQMYVGTETSAIALLVPPLIRTKSIVKFKKVIFLYINGKMAQALF